MLLKRAQRKRLPLIEAVQKFHETLLEPLPSDHESSSRDQQTLRNCKNIVLFLLGIAYRKFGSDIENEQEILAGISDCMMAVFALESCLLRSQKRKPVSELAGIYTSLLLHRSLLTIDVAAGEMIATCSDGDDQRTNLGILRKLLRRDSTDVISLRRVVARRLIDRGKYGS
jgi:hypothetical protein